MSASRPRPRLLLAAALLLVPAAAPGQETSPAPPTTATKDVLPFGPGLLLPGDSTVPPKLLAVRQYLRGRQWDQAAQVLQGLFDAPEDVFVPVTRRGPDGKEITTPVSMRAEANRLLAELPPPGREAYEAFAGRPARQALAAAHGQPAALAAVVQRYGHTRAGAEAAAGLGAHHLDRGHFDLAAAYFDRLLHSTADTPPLLLFQAALAFRRAGDRDRAEQAWKRLAAAAPDGIETGGRTISLADLEKQLNRSAGNAVAAATGPFLPETRWRQATLSDGLTCAWVADAMRRQETAPQPALPAGTPLAVGGKVVYRDGRGVRAVDLGSGRLAWESPSELALDNLLPTTAGQAHVGPWLESYLAGHPNVLLQNTVLGLLSTDGRRVYAVEDLPVPPYPDHYYAFHLRQGEGQVLADAPELNDALHHSRLLAINLDSGKVAWELGGRAGLLYGVHFLGPPLALDGRLYVLVQRGFDLRLFCLRPLSGEVVWAQTLATFRSRLILDGGRRLHALRPTYGDGLLVCPTHAGGVVAFDLVARGLAWAHVYRDEPPPPPSEMPLGFGRGGRGGRRPRPVLVHEPPNLAPEWQHTAPVIAGDKVVFTAPDAPEVWCLGLRDGAPLWQASRLDGDLFLAGWFGDAVLVAGRRGMRALNLADGKPLWQCDTLAATGRGASAGGVYHLPTRGPDGRAEVVGIDLAKGAVAWRAALPDKEPAGNLLLGDGMMLSQGHDSVTAYARKSAEKKP